MTPTLFSNPGLLYPARLHRAKGKGGTVAVPSKAAQEPRGTPAVRPPQAEWPASHLRTSTEGAVQS